MDNASNSQYGTPTPVATIGQPQKVESTGTLPHTGIDLVFVAVFAAVALGVGLIIRFS